MRGRFLENALALELSPETVKGWEDKLPVDWLTRSDTAARRRTGSGGSEGRSGEVVSEYWLISPRHEQTIEALGIEHESWDAIIG